MRATAGLTTTSASPESFECRQAQALGLDQPVDQVVTIKLGECIAGLSVNLVEPGRDTVQRPQLHKQLDLNSSTPITSTTTGGCSASCPPAGCDHAVSRTRSEIDKPVTRMERLSAPTSDR